MSTDADRIERLLGAVGRALSEDFSSPIEPGSQPDMLQPVEAAVGALIAELAEAKHRNREQILEIHAKNRELLDRQARALAELSTPVIAVWDGILALPLIGAIDVARGQALLEAVLNRVVQERACYVIIDLTGATNLDLVSAQYLVQTGHALKLLGANCLLTGMSPEIARTLVQLQIDLMEVRTTRSLGEALKTAFAEMNSMANGANRRERPHE